MIRVAIGIQARSTSERFPGKVFEKIDGREMLKHVVDIADKYMFYSNRHTANTKIEVSKYVLCPRGDPIKARYKTFVPVIEGDEFDVLSRYVKLLEAVKPDYIVRITGDCPLLDNKQIGLHVKLATKNCYDYVSNVDPEYRTAYDGNDVEVFSAAALSWADQNAKNKSDREHVTTLMRTSAFTEAGFKYSTSNEGKVDLSHIKLSVDTIEDLERVRSEYQKRQDKLNRAQSKLGKSNVHQI